MIIVGDSVNKKLQIVKTEVIFMSDQQTILMLARVLKSSDQAIMVNQLLTWQYEEARINDPEDFHDGRWWVYMPIREWQEQLSWISEHTIRRNLKELKELGLIRIGNFNPNRYDRTRWYAVDEQALEKRIQKCTANK